MKNKNLTDLENQKKQVDEILKKLLLNGKTDKEIIDLLKIYYDNLDEHKRILSIICNDDILKNRLTKEILDLINCYLKYDKDSYIYLFIKDKNILEKRSCIEQIILIEKYYSIASKIDSSVKTIKGESIIFILYSMITDNLLLDKDIIEQLKEIDNYIKENKEVIDNYKNEKDKIKKK